MARALILFGTRKGTTKVTAEVLAETMILRHGYDVELVNIRHKKSIKHRLNEFDYFIMGSSIVSGRWKSGVLRFIKRRDLAGRKIALFVTAGGTMNKVVKDGITKKQAQEEAVHNYIDKYLEKLHFTPVAKSAFGGMVVRSGKQKYNSWNREDIESWGIRLGELFSKSD